MKFSQHKINPCSTIEPNFHPSLEDIQRESILHYLLQEVWHEPDRNRAKLMWHRISELHAKRGPEYVRFLELQQGLYRHEH